MTRAIRIRETGGPEVMEMVEHDSGAPGPGSVQLRTTAIGLNFIDVYFRTGLYPRPLPFVPGLEGAGIVEEVGPQGVGLVPGDRVAWASVPGSYSERLVAPAPLLVKIPDGISDETAAAVMLQGMTAHYLVHGVRQTRPGDVAVVHAAAGGVGLLLIQMLKAAGATVLGTCSTAEKEALARGAGADHVVRYTEQDFTAETRRVTDGAGAHVVYDSVGRTTFQGSLESLRPRGLLALFGQSSGKVPPMDPQLLNDHGSLFLTRPSLVHYTRGEELELRASAVLDAVAAGDLSVRIGDRFSLSDAAQAHSALEGRKTTGKVLLIP